ncbi:MAG: AarF/UbiB family protein [Actinomycetota bacterium]|nr:AarF/UbiB family protein [Actinomycetota bacterium]MDA8279409.1 AarF/UbiB family protein [Actinomycetota bacterium]
MKAPPEPAAFGSRAIEAGSRAMLWQQGLDDLRAAAAASVPQMLRRRRVPPAPRLATTAGHLAVAAAGWWLVDRRRDRSGSRVGAARRVRRAFERLGPTYIKLGQILSAGEGLFPSELVTEFHQCRDRVPAEPFPVVRRTIETDLGVPLAAVFRSFDPVPLAAASIALVHAAELRDGTPVVVKVQRSGIERLVRRDVAVMSWLAELLTGRIPVAALANPPALVEVFAETIVEELDFRLEAQNMLDVAAVLDGLDQRALVVPRPHHRLVTRRVLVMERLSGFAWGDTVAMRAAGVDTAEALRSALRSLLEGAMLAGVFHGDLHGGNLLVAPDGRVVLLDFGITGRLGPVQRLALLRMVVSATANDVPGQVAAMRDLGALPADVDVPAVIADLGLDRLPVDPAAMDVEELTAEVRALASALLAYGARLPKALMLFVKDMLFLDGALAVMAPDLDILAEIASLVTYFHERHGAAIAQDLGLDPGAPPLIDLAAVRSSLGLTDEIPGFTVQELQERRALLRRRLARHRAGVSPA